MIHYHGTPVGGSRQDAARFLIGRHALIPYARPDDLAIALDVCQSFILDNSAFTHWKSGAGEVPFDDYMAWVRSIYRHPGFDWALIPDVIDGDVERNSRLVRDWLRCGPKFKGVPVWHLHEPLEYLEWLVANFETVAFGSSGAWSQPNSPAWWLRMADAMRVACDAQGRPLAQLHGLAHVGSGCFHPLALPLMRQHERGDQLRGVVAVRDVRASHGLTARRRHRGDYRDAEQPGRLDPSEPARSVCASQRVAAALHHC